LAAAKFSGEAAELTENGRTRPTNRSTVLPDHGSKDLKLGTLRAAVRQLGLDWATFQKA